MKHLRQSSNNAVCKLGNTTGCRSLPLGQSCLLVVAIALQRSSIPLRRIPFVSAVLQSPNLFRRILPRVEKLIVQSQTAVGNVVEKLETCVFQVRDDFSVSAWRRILRPGNLEAEEPAQIKLQENCLKLWRSRKRSINLRSCRCSRRRQHRQRSRARE